jgi:hypothetical protein
MPNPTSPFYRALADLKHWARVLGAPISRIAVSNIDAPPSPDWQVERHMGGRMGIPFVGRQVLLREPGQDDPLAAIVTKLWGSNAGFQLVNVCAFARDGSTFPLTRLYVMPRGERDFTYVDGDDL